MTSTLTFQNTHFNVVENSNQIWLAAADIAKALGYANSNSISRIYRRNSDEFSSGMTEEVKLALSGNQNPNHYPHNQSCSHSQSQLANHLPY
ncbi:MULTISPECIES: BRO family protein [Vibrio]|uniref:BRO family protein n=1 Tax=Vibrio TaxID=662 RepID=UPI001F551753|nr:MULTISPECIES: BRO family protein [Vibrio]WJG27001.1 BRO family protein [Vibrio furnissii]